MCMDSRLNPFAFLGLEEGEVREQLNKNGALFVSHNQEKAMEDARSLHHTRCRVSSLHQVHIIRNGGGRISRDVLRALVASQQVRRRCAAAVRCGGALAGPAPLLLYAPQPRRPPTGRARSSCPAHLSLPMLSCLSAHYYGWWRLRRQIFGLSLNGPHTRLCTHATHAHPRRPWALVRYTS